MSEMPFEEFEKLFDRHLAEMLSEGNHLYQLNLDPDVLWETYLNSFPPGTNEVYRTRRAFDCSCCRHFIKHFGNLVSIAPDYTLHSLWDFDPLDPTYTPVTRAMATFVHAAAELDNLFVTKTAHLGQASTMDFSASKVIRWHHFYSVLPRRLVYTGEATPNEVAGRYKTGFQVFKRGLEELSPSAFEIVLEMLDEGTLYRGEEHRATLATFRGLQAEYLTLAPAQKTNFAWYHLPRLNPGITSLRNHALGTLLVELSAGEEVETCLRRYEAMVAPANYRRPQPKFTAKMLEKAKQGLADLGLLNSLARKFAALSDVSIQNVLWANRNVRRAMLEGGAAFFEALTEDVTPELPDLRHIPALSLAEFLEILPRVTTLELLFENRLETNLVSLIAPVDPSAPPLTRWQNGFTWAYTDNLADAGMKKLVQERGGKIDGVLRFSIQWNESGDNQDDLDAHVDEPSSRGQHIYYGNLGPHASTGRLDVDIRHPGNRIAVENITWTDRVRMPLGVYRCYVHNFNKVSRSRNGVRAEIEFDGQIFRYDLSREIKNHETIMVAEVTKNADQSFSIKHGIPLASSGKNHASRKVWNLDTAKFHRVSAVMLSPNYWDAEGFGNKHYFFMLADCENPTNPHGFFNEFLPAALNPHRKVLEALGEKTKVAYTPDQMSGLGFSTTIQNAIICKIDGKLQKIVI